MTKLKQDWKKIVPYEEGGLHQIKEIPVYTSMNHNPPTHIYIPPGYTFTHICPACGQKQVIEAINII